MFYVLDMWNESYFDLLGQAQAIRGRLLNYT